MVVSPRGLLPTGRKRCLAVVPPLRDEETAALTGLDIAFVAEKRVGVLHRDDAGARFVRQRALGRQARPGNVISLEDRLAEALVESQVAGFHLVISKLLVLVIL